MRGLRQNRIATAVDRLRGVLDASSGLVGMPEVAAAIDHLGGATFANKPVDAVIGFDTNAVFALVRSKSAPVIDFLNTQHRAPLVLPGQVMSEIWNQREDLPKIAETVHQKLAELRKLLEEVGEVFVGNDIQPILGTIDGLTWNEFGSLSEAQERLKLFFDVILARGAVPHVPRSDFRGVGLARMSAKVPPGFEDRKKDRGELGDFFVWADFLYGVLQSDLRGVTEVLFVTNDAKRDWRTTTGRPHPVLCAEVAAACGLPFRLVKSDEFRSLCSD